MAWIGFNCVERRKLTRKKCIDNLYAFDSSGNFYKLGFGPYSMILKTLQSPRLSLLSL